jgi:hypothetical protein
LEVHAANAASHVHDASQAAQLANIHRMLVKHTGVDAAKHNTVEQLVAHVLKEQWDKRAGSCMRISCEKANLAHLDHELRVHHLEQQVSKLRHERDALLDFVIELQVRERPHQVGTECNSSGVEYLL